MTFLRRYGYSAIGYCMIVSALCVQFSCAFRIIFDPENPHVKLENCMEGLFCAGAVMISYGAVLGKTTPSMLMVMGILETMAFWVNNWIVFDVLGAHDVGGGMVIHTFGAYFGLAATFVLYDVGSDEHKDEATCYSSDLFSLTGTLLLWLLWPSFNAAVAGSPEAENLAIVNTLICGCGCILGFGVVSRVEWLEVRHCPLAERYACGWSDDGCHWRQADRAAHSGRCGFLRSMLVELGLRGADAAARL